MSKKNIILSCLLAVLLVCTCMLMTACAKNYEVKWNVDSNATVVVEGSKKLPSKAEENSAITFTAEGKAGYQIASVTYKIGSKERPLNAKDGKYTVTVSGELEIIVKSEKAIESVSAAMKSDAKTYYTGDELDLADVTVTAHYKTGDSEPVTNYSVNYASEDVVAFSRGDTGFTVTYKGVTSDPVTFASPVETKVVLNVRGGTISDTAFNALQTNQLLKNVTKDNDGLVSFTFADISTENAIDVPVDVEFPEDEGGWSFKNWKSMDLGAIDKISNDTITTSTELNAIYNVNILQIKKVNLELVEGAPYLKIDVEFLGNGTVYPYLYEGNQKISLKGDDVAAVKGETKTISVPLTQLAEASSEELDSFENKWMDICVSTTIHGIRYSTSVVLDAETDVADVGSMIHDDNNVYKLHYYYMDGKVELKVFFQTYEYSYSIDAKEVDGVPSLVIEGQLAASFEDDFAKLAGGKVSIGTWGLTGTIADDGSWKIVAALKDIEMSTKVAGAITFESADGDDYIEITANGEKFSIAACTNVLPYSGTAYGNPKYYYETKTFGIYQVTYGSDWNEPFLEVANVDKTVDFGKMELVAEDSKPYVVISGTYGKGYTVETFKAAINGLLAQKDGLSIQQYNGSWPYLDLKDKVVITAEDGQYSVKIDISGALVDQLYYLHVNNVNYTATDWTKGQSITINGVRYTLNNGSGADWLEPLTCIWVKNADEVDPEFTATAAALEEKDGAAYLVLTGTWNTEKCDATRATEEIANIKNCKLEHYWTGNPWETFEPTPTGEANVDGTFKIYLAIAEATAGQFWYIHFGTNDNNVKVPIAEGAVTTLTIGNVTYTLSVHEANDWTNGLTAITVTVVE